MTETNRLIDARFGLLADAKLPPSVFVEGLLWQRMNRAERLNLIARLEGLGVTSIVASNDDED